MFFCFPLLTKKHWTYNYVDEIFLRNQNSFLYNHFLVYYDKLFNIYSSCCHIFVASSQIKYCDCAKVLKRVKPPNVKYLCIDECTRNYSRRQIITYLKAIIMCCIEQEGEREIVMIIFTSF